MDKISLLQSGVIAKLMKENKTLKKKLENQMVWGKVQTVEISYLKKQLNKSNVLPFKPKV